MAYAGSRQARFGPHPSWLDKSAGWVALQPGAKIDKFLSDTLALQSPETSYSVHCLCQLVMACDYSKRLAELAKNVPGLNWPPFGIL